MNEDIVKEFVHFYYKCLNDNTVEQHLIPHLKDNSRFIRHNIELYGIQSILSQITKKGVIYTPTKINIMLNGDRRANLLITGHIHDPEVNNIITFSEYMLFSISNKKEYWIHSSILHLIKE